MDKVDAGIFSLQYSYSCYHQVLQVISQRKLCAHTTPSLELSFILTRKENFEPILYFIMIKFHPSCPSHFGTN